MKRFLTVAIIAINALLLAGWLGFEWFVEDRDEPAVRRESSGGDGMGQRDRRPVPKRDPVQIEESSPFSGPVTADDPFDWRRAASSQSDGEPRPRPSMSPATAEPLQKVPEDSPPPGRSPAASSPTPRPPARETATTTAGVAVLREGDATARQPNSPAEETRRDDPSEDIRPPELEWIRFTPSEVVAGGESMLSASAVDDVAGVREIVGRISSPSGNAHLGFALTLNEGVRTWETMVRVPEKAESGRWQITWLRVTDKANNSRDDRWGAGGAPPGSNLLVSSNEGDADPPRLHSVTLDRQTMSPGEAVNVTIEVTDEISGVRFVSGTFQSPSGKAWAPFTTSEQGGAWSGPVTVPEDGECGEWTLQRVTAIDEANNQATWGSADERVGGISFYRSFSGSCDSDPPVLTRLELSPKMVANETASQVHVTAFIDDLASGVASASGFVIAADHSTASPQRIHFVLRKSSESPAAPWIGTIEIPQHSMIGRWEVRALRLSDQARNQKTYGLSDPAMADGWFMVE
ncbi:MAG: hypothetical protein KY432_03030 [Acidobacteria bacterium]|nr:hypothetical protein [Acidobacteriota bacterium]